MMHVVQLMYVKINTIAAGVQIYCTWKLGYNQAYLGCLTNRIATQLIALESCSNP